MKNNYYKAYKEVIEILKYVPKESVNKIPQSMIDMFNKKMNISWNFQVDVNKTFEEQNLLDETKAIFANIYKDYWASPEEREEINKKEQNELAQIEIINSEISICFDENKVFKNKSNKSNEVIKEDKSDLPVEQTKEKFFKNIIRFFKRLFRI